GDRPGTGETHPEAHGLGPGAGRPQQGHSRDSSPVFERRQGPARSQLAPLVHPRPGIGTGHCLVQKLLRGYRMTALLAGVKEPEVIEATACRGCGRQGLHLILSLGRMPLANALLTAEQLDQPEAAYPLDLAFCPGCSLVQIIENVPPQKLFSEYLYFSS